MEMDWVDLTLRVGIPVAALIGLAVFFWKEGWPYIKDRIEKNDAAIKALAASKEADQKAFVEAQAKAQQEFAAAQARAQENFLGALKTRDEALTTSLAQITTAVWEGDKRLADALDKVAIKLERKDKRSTDQ